MYFEALFFGHCRMHCRCIFTCIFQGILAFCICINQWDQAPVCTTNFTIFRIVKSQFNNLWLNYQCNEYNFTELCTRRLGCFSCWLVTVIVCLGCLVMSCYDYSYRTWKVLIVSIKKNIMNLDYFFCFINCSIFQQQNNIFNRNIFIDFVPLSYVKRHFSHGWILLDALDSVYCTSWFVTLADLLSSMIFPYFVWKFLQNTNQLSQVIITWITALAMYT